MKKNNIQIISNLLILIFLLFILAACPVGDIPNSGFSNDGDSADSALSSSIGSNVLLPPLYSQAYILNDAGLYRVRIDWDSVAYAEAYEVYSSSTSDGEFSLVTGGLLGANQFEDRAEISYGDKKFYKIRALKGSSDNCVYSPFTNVMEVNIKVESTFTQKVQWVTLSKGVSQGVLVKWTPVEGAYSYKIERFIHKEPNNPTVIKSVYIPINNKDSELLFVDNTVNPAYLYDYVVTCFDIHGTAGISSDRGIEGWTRSIPENVYTRGSSFRDGTAAGAESIFEVCWTTANKQVYWSQEANSGAGGVVFDNSIIGGNEPSDWEVAVSVRPADNIYIPMNNSKGSDYDSLETVSNLLVHSKMNDIKTLLSVLTDDLKGFEGLESNSLSDKWTQFNENEPLFFRLIKNEDDTFTNTIEYRYFGLYTGSVDKSFFYVVRPIYNKGFHDQYEPLRSLMQQSEWVNPIAPAGCTEFNINSSNRLDLEFSWKCSTVNNDDEFIIYSKDSNDFKFIIVEEILKNDDFTAVDGVFTYISEGKYNKTLNYTVSVKRGDNESEMTIPVEIIDVGGEI